MIKKVINISVLFCLLFVSCKYGNKLPSDFPNEKEFAQILADIHFAESTINQIRVKHRGVDTLVNNYYHDVLEKYNLSQVEFDTIVSWYIAHPDLYRSVYELSIGVLSEKEAKWQREVKNIKEEEEKLRKIKAARNIWPTNKAFSISENDTFDRQIPFLIQVDTIHAQGYRVSAFYQFLKGSEVKKPELEVFALFEDSTIDTLAYVLPTSFTSKKAELLIGIHEDLKIIQLQGFLMKHDTNQVIKAKIKHIEFEFIPKDDSISVE